MKRILIVLTSLSLIAGFVAATPAKVSAAPAQSTYDGGGIDYVVSQYGSLGGDTCENPDFRTIQDAVDEAERHALGSADSVIYVCNGVYHEEIDATLGLTLVGENRQKTILDGSLNSEYEGGIIDSSDDVTVWDITLRNGDADNQGGAIYTSNGAGPGSGEVYCNNSVFISNTSGDDGGAIHASNDVHVANCIFDQNYSDDDGGAIYTQDSFYSYSSTYTNNEAYEDGGVVHADELILSRLDLFANNRTDDDDGAAIYVSTGDQEGTIDRSVFRQNFADDEGGAVYYSNNYYLTIISSSFIDNYAEDDGGALNLTGSSFGGDDDYLSISGTSRAPTLFQGNYTTDNGGAIFVENSYGINGMYVSNARFTDNVAEYAGGAIYSENEITLSTVTFTGNQARDGNGGAITGYEGIEVNRSTFTRNVSFNSDGGAIFANDYLEITASTFSSNTADDGGAITKESNGSMIVEGSTFTANQAHGDEGVDVCTTDGPSFCAGQGGAIWTYGDSTISRSTFKNNSATDEGGAIMANDESSSGADLRVLTSTFIGNQAEEAGALSARYLDMLELRGNLFQSNRAFGADPTPQFNWAVGAVMIAMDVAEQNHLVIGNRFISNVGWGVGALYIVDDECADSGDLFTAANMRANTWRSNRVTGGQPQTYRDVRHDGDFSGCGG